MIRAVLLFTGISPRSFSLEAEPDWPWHPGFCVARTERAVRPESRAVAMMPRLHQMVKPENERAGKRKRCRKTKEASALRRPRNLEHGT
jgi:hypothetical protein